MPPTHTPDPDPAPPEAPAPLLRARAVAHSLGVSGRTLERLLAAGRFPPPDLRLGRITLRRPATVRAWIDAECRPRGPAR